MDIELIAPAIAAYQMPHPPEAILYISRHKAVLGIAYPLQALLENPKTLVDVEWLNGALLIIVWTAQALEELTELLLDVAGDCGIPISITIDL
jgi:hypothetical protein